MFSGKCVERIFKKLECFNEVMDASSYGVQKSFCQTHAYCYSPTRFNRDTGEDNEEGRCRNLRYSINSKYCLQHAYKKGICAGLVDRYKGVCGEGEIQSCDTEVDVTKFSPSHLQEFKRASQRKIADLKKCVNGRNEMEKQCIHPSAGSEGHRRFLENLYSNIDDCFDLLEEIADYVPPTEKQVPKVSLTQVEMDQGWKPARGRKSKK